MNETNVPQAPTPPTNNSDGTPTTAAPVPAAMPSNSPLRQPSAKPIGLPSSSPDQVRDYILSIALDMGDEFLDPDSYQSKALAWVMTQEVPSLIIATVDQPQPYAPKSFDLSLEQEVKQLYALACFYYSTNRVANLATDQFWLPNLPPGTGELPGWFDETGWLSDAATKCSQWYGIVCNQQGLVEALVMNDNLLSGKIPKEIGLLNDSLIYFDVRENFLANIGYGDHIFLEYLTNVKYLKLAFNYLKYDGIPPQLGAMTSLVELDFSYMLWYGQLKEGIFQNFQNLETLVMGGNEYNSSLPADLVQLPRLKFLYAEFTELNGDLNFMSKLTSIEEVWIDQNPIVGSIPTAIENAELVQSLSFTSCQISGSIPTSIGKLQKLQQVWMSYNQLTGTVPYQFASIKSLTRLHLQGNDLNGAMPESICALRFPFGRLTSLQADCDDAGNVDCGTGSCCTCCGPYCSDA